MAHKDCIFLRDGAHFRNNYKMLMTSGSKIFYNCPVEYHLVMIRYQELIDIHGRILLSDGRKYLDFSNKWDREELERRKWAKVPTLHEYIIRLQTEHKDKYKEIFG